MPSSFIGIRSLDRERRTADRRVAERAAAPCAFIVESAGSQPASRVNPLTVATLREFGIEWSGHAPKGIDAVIGLERIALELRVRAIANQAPAGPGAIAADDHAHVPNAT